ncbi:MAG: NADH-ubiquinone oxidoreductase chain [Rickettsiaceae bacterium]|jgi:NADH-quinone oxidoreductase subunit J|nr:NADH-ubiquinone oxidoreductase chain [Rickettsiaceae bacterium]
MVESLFFYIFAFVAIFSSLMVVTVKNSVHSVLWLIFTFFNAAGLFLLVGAEFLAMLLVVVYVGAVAVLFLFVIMMLDINLNKVREGFFKRLPLGIFISGVFLFDLITIIYTSLNQIKTIPRSDYMTPESLITNTHAIGNILYTDFVLQFQLAGLILFAAMIGCIVLTLRDSKRSKKQDATTQQIRNKESSVTLVKVGRGEGVDVR